MLALEDGTDRWPTFASAKYECAIADLVQAAGHEITNWQIQHLDPLTP